MNPDPTITTVQTPGRPALTITFDPTGKLNLPYDEMIEACGLLLPWALQSYRYDDPSTTLADGLAKRYGFFAGWNPLHSGAEVSEEGNYSYPGDPMLSPYAALKLDDEELFIYPYAIVVDRMPDTTRQTRMD